MWRLSLLAATDGSGGREGRGENPLKSSDVVLERDRALDARVFVLGAREASYYSITGLLVLEMISDLCC